MATPKHQRIFIWIIAGVMLVGTFGTFAALIIGNEQGEVSNVSDAETQRQIEEFQRQQEEAARANAASSEPLPGYATESFDPASITELKTETLKEGSGDTATAESMVVINYFGWLPDGTIFDSSRKDGTTTPLGSEGDTGVPANGFIPGFNEALIGMKPGEVKKVFIPAAEAYGEQGNPPLIDPNTPIAFVIELVSIQQ